LKVRRICEERENGVSWMGNPELGFERMGFHRFRRLFDADEGLFER
jgi:hypothetical protein